MLGSFLKKRLSESLIRCNLNYSDKSTGIWSPLLYKSWSYSSMRYNSLTNYSKLNYFEFFPVTFPNNGPPRDSFLVNLRNLKKEFLKLQQNHHPDLIRDLNDLKGNGNAQDEDENSKLLNKAYSTLKSPLSRAQYILLLHGIDITSDEINNQYKQMASSDNELLMMILDTHEQLETCKDFDELKILKSENDTRIKQSEKVLNELFSQEKYPEAALESIKLNYWVNLKGAIRDWEPGAPVNLTH